jgi:hypothetical protein
MQYNVFGSKHQSNVQGNEEIVEIRNKHGNGDESISSIYDAKLIFQYVHLS